MSFNWKSLVATVAPTIATALGGPLAGMAVKELGAVLGIEAPTEENVSAALAGATPEVLAKMKAADQDFGAKMKSLDIDLEKIAAGDRDSARKMATDTKSYAPAVLATIVTVGFFGILIGLLTGIMHTKDTPELLLLIGSLGTAWGAVMNFYFGSSAGSQNKDATIKSLTR